MYHILADYQRNIPTISYSADSQDDSSNSSQPEKISLAGVGPEIGPEVDPNVGPNGDQEETSRDSLFHNDSVMIKKQFEKQFEEHLGASDSETYRIRKAIEFYKEDEDSSDVSDASGSDEESSIRDLPITRLNSNSSSLQSSPSTSVYFPTTQAKPENLDAIRDLSIPKAASDHYHPDSGDNCYETLLSKTTTDDRWISARSSIEPTEKDSFKITEIKCYKEPHIAIDIIDLSSSLRRRRNNSTVDANQIDEGIPTSTSISSGFEDKEPRGKSSYDLGLILENGTQKRNGTTGKDEHAGSSAGCGCLNIFRTLGNMCDGIRDICRLMLDRPTTDTSEGLTVQEYQRQLSERVAAKDGFEKTRCYHY